ncbi:MAG: lipoyl(octanoyl) transferase LipB [Proteobacteria bacterium]|nr:lipoyl(octanoyl) transferase LipB [Pseudomonadota bacterium]
MEVQRALAAEVRAGGPDCVAFFTHPPTVTLGRSTPAAEFPVTAALRRLGVAVLATDRGGQATWHGPGQVVGYPIVDLRRRGLAPAAFVARVLAAVSSWANSLGVAAAASVDPPGVWVGERKIASVGMRLAGRVTRHGFAVNLTTQEAASSLIRPCGMEPGRMGSLALAGVDPPGPEEAARGLGAALAAVL